MQAIKVYNRRTQLEILNILILCNVCLLQIGNPSNIKMRERLSALVAYMIITFLCIKGRSALNFQLPNQKETFNTETINNSSRNVIQNYKNVYSRNKKIVCYFGSWSVHSLRFDIENDIDPNICTHIIYAFASFDESGKIVETDTGTI